MSESIGANTMSMDRILNQLSSLKDNSASFAGQSDADEIWNDDIRALESAISIISALQDNGVTDAQEVHDIFYDYHTQAKQVREMHRKYETITRPFMKDDVWHCPECNHRVHPRHSYCHWCGKKLGEAVER